MAKIRVHELAKEFGIASKEMAAKVKKLGYNIKNYMSTLEEYEAQDVRRRLKGELGKETIKPESQVKTVIRRRHRVIHLKKIIYPKVSLPEELPVEKPAEIKVAKPQETAEIKLVEEVGPVSKPAPEAEPKPEPAPEEEKETKKEEVSTPEIKHEQVVIEPQQEKPVKKSMPTKEIAEKAQIPSKSKVSRPKSFVKILDRPRIEISQLKTRTTPRPSRPSRPSRPPQKIPSAPVDISTAPKRKKERKGKRVVQISELEGASKRRRTGPKQKRRQGYTNRFPGRTKGLKSYSKAEQKKAKKEASSQFVATPSKAIKRKFAIYETIQVLELAKRMGIKVGELILTLMDLGVMATANQSIDYDVASVVASQFGYELEKKAVAEDMVNIEETGGGEPVIRPPVVTVMGHVDHGKTTLLDAIRKADVASKEAGGITQRIGAYHVTLPSGQEVVFLDTPGHEAFTAMRARGAKITDIVILLVAADDGVMAQTREAIDHARAAGVPIIVAINKIDKPGADPEKVKRELAKEGLVPEDWGGDTICINISAKKRIGIEELLEMMALQAEVLELKADPNRPARGHVIEARLDKGCGPVATLLVAEGTLHTGDALVCGIYHGKIRAMFDDKGKAIKTAGPSMPVEVQGLSGVPEAGNEFIVLSDNKKAKEVSDYRQQQARELELAKSAKVSLENVFDKLQEEELKGLNVVIKTDVQGSIEALSEALLKLSTQAIKVNIVRTGIGSITESDVLLASASKAIIIGFNVKPSLQAKALAEQEQVEIRFYDVIYHAIEDVKKAMVGMLEPVYNEKALGRAEVRNVFHIAKVGSVAGSYVLEGVIQRNAMARLLRDNVVIYTGSIASLHRFKEDAKEVQAGYECGIGLKKFNDIKAGDTIETYLMEEIAPVLGESSDGRRDSQTQA
ncbi:MAG: translation initiation factor IF-2 [Nitrospiraceae bacterium]|nr:translation initiation factor IF-2 [Nitrospiraceae bacterium]